MQALMIGGSFLGKKIVDALPVAAFLVIVEAAIFLFGVWFLLK